MPLPDSCEHNSIIYKYPLEIVEHQIFMVPLGTKALHVANQHGQICLWTLQSTNPELPQEKLIIRILGTGQEADLFDYEYLGTVLQGVYVWHVFV